MKSNTKLIPILFLLLIGLNCISSTSLTLKDSRGSRFSDPRAASAAAAQPQAASESLSKSQKLLKIMNKAVDIKDPRTIGFFVMGILSNWMPIMDKIVKKMIELNLALTPCVQAFQDGWKLVKGEPETDPSLQEESLKTQQKIASDEAKIAEQEAKDEQTDGRAKKQICGETKQKVEQIWNFAAQELNLPQETVQLAAQGNSELMPAEGYCVYPNVAAAKETQKLIAKEFGNNDDFYDACVVVRTTTDCDKVDNKGAWYYIKQSVKFIPLVLKSVMCINNLLGKSPIEEIKSLYAQMVSRWPLIMGFFKNLGSFLLHLVTFGMWGALKAAWKVIKLGFALFILYRRRKQTIGIWLPFELGKLVGIALDAIKSLLVGRRRRK